jgi:hypothetical protein
LADPNKKFRPYPDPPSLTTFLVTILESNIRIL